MTSAGQPKSPALNKEQALCKTEFLHSACCFVVLDDSG